MTNSEKATLRKARKAIQRKIRLRKNLRSNGNGFPSMDMILVKPLDVAHRSAITPFNQILTDGFSNVSRAGRNFDAYNQ